MNIIKVRADSKIRLILAYAPIHNNSQDLKKMNFKGKSKGF